MKTPKLAPVLALALASLLLPQAQAAVKLPALFSEHAVLQRGMPLPVWGTADPGEDVTVSLADQTQTTKAAADGKWKVMLKPLKEAESLTLTVKGTNTPHGKRRRGRRSMGELRAIEHGLRAEE